MKKSQICEIKDSMAFFFFLFSGGNRLPYHERNHGKTEIEKYASYSLKYSMV